MSTKHPCQQQDQEITSLWYHREARYPFGTHIGVCVRVCVRVHVYEYVLKPNRIH